MGFVVKRDKPWHGKVFAAGLAVLVVLVFISGYLVGWSAADRGYDTLETENDALAERVSNLSEAEQDLRARLAILERGKQIDDQASIAVREQIQQLQSENLELREELNFYRALVSPEEARAGINIHSLQLLYVPDQDVYRYTVMLTRSNRKKDLIQGKVDIFVDGLLNEKVQRYSVNELSDVQDNLRYRFRYFQTIEGTLKLPDGFDPQGIVVHLLPSGGKSARIERTFSWITAQIEQKQQPVVIMGDDEAVVDAETQKE